MWRIVYTVLHVVPTKQEMVNECFTQKFPGVSIFERMCKGVYMYMVTNVNIWEDTVYTWIW